MSSTLQRRGCIGSMSRLIELCISASRSLPVSNGHANTFSSTCKPRSLVSAAVHSRPSNLAFCRTFHATSRRHNEFGVDFTDGHLLGAAASVATLLAIPRTRRLTKRTVLSIVGLIGAIVVYGNFFNKPQPVAFLRVQDILALAAESETKTRVSEAEAVSTASNNTGPLRTAMDIMSGSQSAAAV